MNTRERFQALMNYEPVDRLPLLEWAGWWKLTLERWQREGLEVDPKDQDAIRREFGLETYRQAWLRSVHWEAPRPRAHGTGFLPGDQDYAREYEQLRPRLFQVLDEWPVNPRQMENWQREHDAGDIVIWFTLDGFFWLPRALFGIEDHFYAFYDDPELMHRINRENAEWMCRIIDRLCEFCRPDFMTFAEDMSYNHGPMLSRELFDEFMLPYYQIVVPKLREKGILPFVDSDGNLNDAAGWFADAGIAGLLPLEKQAGVDLNVIREKCPEMRFIGHFDKLTMHRGEAVMRAEFERLLPLASQGGFAISCDHQTPPEVSLEDYRLYLRLFREYAERAGSVSRC
jgi:hypothetical protein